MTNITNVSAWRDLAERIGRNWIQLLLPLFVAWQTGEVTGFDPVATVTALGLAGAVSVLSYVAGWTVDPRDSLPLQVAERALKAGASALVVLAGTDGLGLLSVSWGSAWWTVLGAAGAAVLHWFLDAPATVAVIRTADL